ncbi:ankyrin repeat domain-containing protein 33B-like [Xyrauchen texanus]|uniref:ankyrin repeat domain-containing protein 33B-like n=1 Tax=Xyrauchen texanus TaxID=154827 RepID=UPI002241C947|nr:ankyrin repeat domain-containing protein 33B-like [Xyrauchen texanus]
MVLTIENSGAGGLQNVSSDKKVRGCNNEEFSIESSIFVESTEDSYFADDEEHHHDDDDVVYQEFEQLDFSNLPEIKRIASDDSFYLPDDSFNYEKCPSPESPEPLSFFKACCTNNAIIVKIMIRQGVTQDEVQEVNKNNKTGLIVACYQGFVDVVIALSQCALVDVNWQDNEGNTALMTAAQAGHSMITNYLLSYFPGLDTERRNCHGFTAMMKAAMQGRAECVRVLIMAGADTEARDYGRKLTPREWTLFTGRYETANLMSRLMEQPCAEQFCDSYHMEWPDLDKLVAQSKEPKSCWRRFLEHACNLFTIRMKTNPVDEGVMDYMVRMTTALASPFIATTCRTVCPGSPPCVGKRRLAVQDILRKQRLAELKNLGPERLNNYRRLFQNSRVQLVLKKQERRASLQPQILRNVMMASTVAFRRFSLLPLHTMRRSSVRPGLMMPKVMLCKAPPTTYIPERPRRRTPNNSQHLQIPKWKYKALKEEKKKAQQVDKLRLPVVRKK